MKRRMARAGGDVGWRTTSSPWEIRRPGRAWHARMATRRRSQATPGRTVLCVQGVVMLVLALLLLSVPTDMPVRLALTELACCGLLSLLCLLMTARLGVKSTLDLVFLTAITVVCPLLAYLLANNSPGSALVLIGSLATASALAGLALHTMSAIRLGPKRPGARAGLLLVALFLAVLTIAALAIAFGVGTMVAPAVLGGSGLMISAVLIGLWLFGGRERTRHLRHLRSPIPVAGTRRMSVPIPHSGISDPR